MTSSDVLKGIVNAMLLEQPKQVIGVLVYDDILAGDVNAKAVGGKVLSVLEASLSAAETRKQE